MSTLGSLHDAGSRLRLPCTSVEELPLIVGKNLRRLRTRQGHSLERLAKLSGVSRAMISQIETGKSAPTISVLGKVALALGVPFAALLDQKIQGTTVLRREDTKVLASIDGGFTSRALFPFDAQHRVEFYELRLAPHHLQEADAHAPGTTENIVVVIGQLEIRPAGEPAILLDEGDAVLFEADVAHVYRNPGDREAVAYLVMSYIDHIG